VFVGVSIVQKIQENIIIKAQEKKAIRFCQKLRSGNKAQ